MARTVTDRDVQSKRQKFKTFRRNEKGLNTSNDKIRQVSRFFVETNAFSTFKSKRHRAVVETNAFSTFKSKQHQYKKGWTGRTIPAKQCPEFFEEGMRTRADQ